MSASKLKLNRAALLLVDVQNEFFRPDGPLAKTGLLPVNSTEKEKLTANVQNLLKAMRKAGRPVVYVNTEFRPGHDDCFFSPAWQRCISSEPFCLVEGSGGAAILDAVKPEEGDFVLTKKGHSAFQHTYLDRLLESLGVDTCVIVGNTLGSMDETARQGAALGYENVLVADASYPLCSPHLETLRGRGFISDTAEVLAWIKVSHSDVSKKPASKPALIIVDVQNKNLSIHLEGSTIRLGAGMTDEERSEIIQNNLSLAAAMRSRGFPVIYLRNAYPSKNETARSRMAQRSGSRHPAFDFLHYEGSNWGVEIVEELTPQPGDIVVPKKAHSAFATTHLHRLLRNLGVKTIIVTGGAITGCVSDTTREGLGLGYRTIFVPDACYSPDSRAEGVPALADRVEVKNTQEMLAELAEAPERKQKVLSAKA
ncbi:MAG: cysteine hydrolase [Chloroflexi bacterium]|nr:cysteine hydrolase [Chloroflexota bacterium]